MSISSVNKKVVFTVLLFLVIVSKHSVGQTEQLVPPKKFQRLWKVVSVIGDARDGTNQRVELKNPKLYEMRELKFRLHKSGAIQQIWTNDAGEVIKSRGVTILELSQNKLVFKEWRAHKLEKRTLIIRGENKATLFWKQPKGVIEFELISEI